MNSQKDVVKVIFVTSTTRRGVNLSTNTTYKKLLTYVEKKFSIIMDRGYSLSYKLSPNDYPMAITDDDEVTFFVEAAGNAIGKPIELFVLEPCVTQPNNQLQIPTSHNPLSRYPIQQHITCIPSSQYHPSTQVRPPYFINQTYQKYSNISQTQTQHQKDTSFRSIFNEIPNYQTQQLFDVGLSCKPSYEVDASQNDSYDVGPSHKQYDHCREGKLETEEEGWEDRGEECGEDRAEQCGEQSDSDYGFISEEENENEDVYVKYISPKDWKENTFSHMPDPLPTPCQNTKQKVPNIIDGNTTVKLAKGVWFPNKQHCKNVIAQKSIEDGYQYKVRNSSKTRYDVVCYNKGCDWKIVTNRAKHGEPFYVTNLYDVHSCSKTQLKTKHRNAYKEVVGDIIMDKLKDPSRVLRPKDIMEDIDNTYHIKISYQQAWRGREAALEKLRGGHAESFSKLPYYLLNLTLTNPGTNADIKTDQYGRFEMCFVAMGVSIRTFLNHLRPLIIVDGAHLKGKYPGSNLLAVGMDGNNQIVPLAFGVCRGESGATWSWFMLKLKQCIGDIPDLVFISDRHLGIAQGIREIFPNAFHGLCCRHLLMNVNLLKKYDWLFWKICKAHRVFVYDYYMNQLLGVDANAHGKLIDAVQARWARAHSPVNRYNYITSNCAESVNALSREARKMPITMLMEFFRGLVQRWYFERREDAAKYEQLGQPLTPYAEKKVHRRILKSGRWRVYGISRYRYQVNDRKQDCHVDLETRECSCLKWQHSGLPCGHVIAVFKEIGITDCAELAKHWFTIKTYKATYAEETNFVGDASGWVIPENFQRVLPPNITKRNAGRPKNTGRIPSRGEKVKINVCTRCGADDHKNSQCRVSMTSTQSFVYPTVDLNEF